MVHIELITEISAPIARCFDLARHIDLHVQSVGSERAIGGVTHGLIGSGEEVTWKGRHLGLQFRHTSRITAYRFPDYFQDSMERGAFQSYRHDHYFVTRQRGTTMTDVIDFAAPYGFVGRAVETLLLKKHMRALLIRRNEAIKQTAENGGWKKYLSA